MLPLRTWLAVLAGKATFALCRALGRFRAGWGGTSLPGWVARKVDPGVLGYLSRRYETLVLVTGTNGKTTTTALLRDLLRREGKAEVISNAEGANMLPGITTAFLKAEPLFPVRKAGRAPKRRLAVLEVDEGSLEAVSGELKAVDMILVTNLFRDQLDRYTEIAVLAEHMARGLAAWPNARLVLNADDPVVAGFAAGRGRVTYYGVADAPADAGSGSTSPLEGEMEASESVLCPRCREPLQFSRRSYSHLGEYRCRTCGFLRPRPQYEAHLGQAPSAPAGGFRLRLPDGRELTLPGILSGLHNVYNMTAALAAAAELGIALSEASASHLARFTAPPGRAESFFWPAAGKEATLVLVKNPAGLSQALRTFLSGEQGAPPPDALIVAINDLAADGRDVSWLWDADFTPLARAGNIPVICSGRRGGDLAVCLKYNGVVPARLRVVPDLEASVRAVLAGPAHRFAILCTYTNLAPYRRILLRRGGLTGEAQDRPSLPQAS